jgi:hypothetical protein
MNHPMKKLYLAIFITICLTACTQPQNNTRNLQDQIDSLKEKLAETYKPGFGEFMSAIQVHHAKLWFAGINRNWKLADFEIHEIREIKDDVQKYETDRSESKLVVMLDPALDSVSYAIDQKNPAIFKNSFIFLTNTCNNCHHEVNYPFNEVKIPDTPPFSNQVFKPVKDK